jgi:hypothetical protein
VKRIKFESDNGHVIEFKSKPPFILKYLRDNMSGEANSIKIPGKDGAVTYDLTRSQRHIEISCSVISKGSREKLMKQSQTENRDYISRCFDPGFFGVLYYWGSWQDKGKKIRCRPTGIPAFEDDINNLTNFNLGFESDGSAWSSIEELRASLGIKWGNHRFPAFTGFPTAFSYITTRAIIYNPTRYDIKPTVTVYNSKLPVYVTNETTGAFLKFKIPVEKNQRMIVDIKNTSAILEEYTDYNWTYKENVIHYLTLDSHLTDFVIVPGNNELTIDKAEDENPILTVTANTPILGV